jgi:hypothetical protein
MMPPQKELDGDICAYANRETFSISF